MKTERLNGSWQGWYGYGPGYPEEDRLKREPFTLDLCFDGADFTGTCRDTFTETLLDRRPATVAGNYIPSLITFVKRYPCLVEVDDTGRTIARWDLPSVDIHYSGLLRKGLFSSVIRFEGEWMIKGDVTNEMGEIESYVMSGWWTMQK